jgi:hypothetical protein
MQKYLNAEHRYSEILEGFDQIKSFFSMISYLISASLNALLKKEIGCSNPSVFFYSKTTANVSKEEKENIRNSLE